MKVAQNMILEKIEYEICPNDGIVHFHALYKTSDGFIMTIRNYYKKYDSTNENTINPWRHLDVRPVYDHHGWEKYISKQYENKESQIAMPKRCMFERRTRLAVICSARRNQQLQ
jgi:hypothetical protein